MIIFTLIGIAAVLWFAWTQYKESVGIMYLDTQKADRTSYYDHGKLGLERRTTHRIGNGADVLFTVRSTQRMRVLSVVSAAGSWISASYCEDALGCHIFGDTWSASGSSKSTFPPNTFGEEIEYFSKFNSANILIRDLNTKEAEFRKIRNGA